MQSDPRLGEGCGYATVPVRQCEVCGEVGIMWTFPLNDTDSMILCDADKKMVERLRDAGPPIPLPPIENDPVYQRLFGGQES